LAIAKYRGIFNVVKTSITVGKFGRLVIPKSLRENLGLHEGSRLLVEVVGGKLEATPDSDAVLIETKKGIPVIGGGVPRKKGQIVAALKAERAEREESLLSRRKGS
jgi:AbrB family looped-hinge helix DNA binding protein